MGPRILIIAALMLAPLAAEAQSFRCVSKDGKRYYGSTIPPECVGRPVEQLNSQGLVIKRIDPQGDEKARLAKEAEAAKKREEAAAAKEATRRNRALLATYTSEGDIEDARARALADNTKAVKEVENRIEAIRKRRTGYQKELELYKGNAKPPAKIADDLKGAEDELKMQEELLAAKKRELDGINAKYDEDKKRYAELTRRR